MEVLAADIGYGFTKVVSASRVVCVFVDILVLSWETGQKRSFFRNY